MTSAALLDNKPKTKDGQPPHLEGLSQSAIAESICKEFPGVSPFNPLEDKEALQSVIAQHGESGAYASSLAYQIQASRGRPMKFSDGENFFTLGFERDGKDVVAICPLGPTVCNVLEDLAKRLSAAGITLHVKKVQDNAASQLRERGFKDANFEDDFSPSDMSDDKYPEVCIDIREFEILAPGKNAGKLRQKTGALLEIPLDQLRRDELKETKVRIEALQSIADDIRGSGDASPQNTINQLTPGEFSDLTLYAMGCWPSEAPAPKGAISTPTYEHSDLLEPETVFAWYRFGDLKSFIRGGLDFMTPDFHQEWSMKSELKEFVEGWCASRAERRGESKEELIKAYECFFEHSSALEKAPIIISRNKEGKITGAILMDQGTSDTLSVVMNLADSRINNISSALMVQALESLRTSPVIPLETPSKIRYLNLGGSEEEPLHQFKRQFRPFHEIKACYLKYTGERTGENG